MGHGSARIARAAGVRQRPSASSSAATPAPSAPSCATPSSPSTTPGGTNAPPPAPAPNAPRPPPPATAPSPGTGAPPPPWTTTCSTSPATGPGRAGYPPPAPASPPTSTRRPATTGRAAHDQRRPPDLGIHHRCPRRPGTPRLPPRRQRAHRPGHRAHPRRRPHLRGHPGCPRGSYVVVPSSQPAAPQPPGPPAAALVSADQVKILLAALDDAADYKRDRAETCADCADQSCTTCQWRLQAAGAYDQLAGQMTPGRRGLRPPATRARPPRHPALAGRTRPPTGRPDSDLAPDSPSPVHHRPATAGDGMTQPDDKRLPPLARQQETPRLRGRDLRQRLGQGALSRRRGQPLGRPATGHDRHRDPEPDLEAEP